MAKNKLNENIKEKILNTTAELVAQKGLKNTSLADISKSVEISKGTLYYYYKSKEDIVFEIADRYLSKVTDEIFKSLNEIGEVSNSAQSLKFVFEKLITAQDRSRFHLSLVTEAITNNDKLKEKYKNKYLEWRELFKTKLESHFRLDVNYETLSHVLLSLVDSLLIQNLLGIHDNNLEEMFELILK